MSSIVETATEEDSQNGRWLEGYEVMVLNGSDSLDKNEIEQKVASVGGKIVQSPPENTSKFIAIAGKDCGIRVKNFKALKTIDLISVDWFLECEKKSKLSDLKSKNFIYLTDVTRNNLKRQVVSVDTVEELKELLNEIVEYERDPEAVKVICNEFLKNKIELPKWQSGFNQVIPLNGPSGQSELDALKTKFEKLKLEMIGAKFL